MKRRDNLFIAENFGRGVPEGDDRERRMCRACGFVDYQNPKIVAGVVARIEGRILLCRRAIEPRRGYWTLPAGFMELGETVAEAAAREAWEEARAKLTLGALLAVYSIPRIGQVQTFFEATLDDPNVSCGPESEEVGLFEPARLPWDALAFPSVHWALTHALEGGPGGPPYLSPPEGAPWAASGASSSGRDAAATDVVSGA